MHVESQSMRALQFGKGIGVLLALAAAIAWGAVCGILHTSYGPVALGGVGLAALGFWLERATLVSANTVARKDFYLILVAGFGFFVIIGIGLVSLSALIATWYLPRF